MTQNETAASGSVRQHADMLALAAEHAPSPGTTHGDCATCQMAADIRMLVAENERLTVALQGASPTERTA